MDDLLLAMERPGRWRVAGVIVLFALVFLPIIPLGLRALGAAGTSESVLGSGFAGSLTASMRMAVVVTAVSFVVGTPVGVCAGLYDLRAKPVLLCGISLTLLLPSFLLAIGWSSLGSRGGPLAATITTGEPACAFVFSAQAVALVTLTALAACRSMSESQVAAARLVGGERTAVTYAVRFVAVPSGLSAALGGVLTLSDPGPGQIFGVRTAAAAILTSFAAQYDFELAARQCLVLALVAMMLGAPLAIIASPRLSAAVLARQNRPHRPKWHRVGARVTMTALLALILVSLLMPLLGLVLPIRGALPFDRVLREISRTAFDSVLYSAGAGIVAVTLGTLIAICVGRQRRPALLAAVACLVLLAIPPSASALGVVALATRAPPWADSLLRSRFTVAAVLGLRFLPVAVLMAMRAWGSLSPSGHLAAAVHGVPLGRYVARVALPQIAPALTVAGLVVALLAGADVVTVLLLHPPGRMSLPLAIFTVMANAPESLVAALCLSYVALAGLVLTLLWAAGRIGNIR